MRTGSVVLALIFMIIASLILIVPSTDSAFACMCAPKLTPMEELQRSTAVFSAKVVDITENKSGNGYDIKFDVERVWKGTFDKIAIIFTPSSGDLCGYEFEEDKKYLVYAYKSGGPLHTSICNRTTPLADAQEDLQFLDAAWLIYKLKFENQVFKIPYRITNANLRWIEADPDFTSIIIPIESEKDGTLELTIPRNLLSAESEPYVDDEFIVLVDGEEVASEEVKKTPCFRTLSVKFSGGSEEIEIIGISATIARAPPVHVTTERDSYPRDLVKVSGCTDLALDDSQVIVELSNPVGQSYLRSPLYPNGDGSFSATFFIEGEQIINGTYTATATYAGHSAASSFIVPEFPVNLMVIAVIGLIAALIVLRLNGMSKQIKVSIQ